MDLAYPLEALIGFELPVNTDGRTSAWEADCGPVTVHVSVNRIRYRVHVFQIVLVFGKKYKHLAIGDMPLEVRFFRGEELRAKRQFHHGEAFYQTCPADWKLVFGPA